MKVSRLAVLPTIVQKILQHPVSGKNKIAALRRFVRWQIGSRLVPGPVIVDFIQGAKLVVTPDMNGATSNIYNGLADFEDMSFLLHCLRKDDLFIDIGANIGAYTVLAGAVVGAECLAFEPIRSTFEHLLDNLKVNQIQDHVRAENMGIGNETGELTFTADQDALNRVLGHQSEIEGIQGVRVPVKKLDDIDCGDKPLLIKIDVEGFESKVLAGALRTLKSKHILGLILEVSHSIVKYGDSTEELHETMLGLGMNCYTYSPFERKLVHLDGNQIITPNRIYIRDLNEVNQRLQSSESFTVHGVTV